MAAPPQCPRCAYDLTGTVGSWLESCPLTCTCSECGLQIQTVDVMRPERLVLRGFVEHARSWRQFLRWSLRTWGWTSSPRFFWTRVELRHAPRPRAAILWLLLLVGGPLLLSNLAGAGLLFFQYGGDPPAYEFMLALLGPLLPWVESPLNGEAGLRWSFVVLPLLGVGLLWPVLLWSLGTTRALAKVRPGHVARAAVFGLAWLPLAILPRLVDMVLPLGGMLLDLLAKGGFVAGQSDRAGISVMLSQLWGLWLLVGFAWTELWWGAVIGPGFRLRPAGAVWLILSIPAALMLIVVWLNVSNWLVRY